MWPKRRKAEPPRTDDEMRNGILGMTESAHRGWLPADWLGHRFMFPENE